MRKMHSEFELYFEELRWNRDTPMLMMLRWWLLLSAYRNFERAGDMK
jgi:hypothetical protein